MSEQPIEITMKELEIQTKKQFDEVIVKAVQSIGIDVDERKLKDMIRRNNPIKPKWFRLDVPYCNSCVTDTHAQILSEDYRYRPCCGQAIDWIECDSQ